MQPETDWVQPCPPTRPHLQVRVDLTAIRHNVTAIRSRVAPAAVMAVVKGDAYGHGLVPAARAARAGGAAWLGTAVLAEALALRTAGDTGRILAWLAAPGADWAAALAAGVDVGVSSAAQLGEVAAAARSVATLARVHLKADTGMGRNGAAVWDGGWAALVRAAADAADAVEVVGAFTHLACADEPGSPVTDGQLSAFSAAVADARAAGLRPSLLHAANSAAALTDSRTHLDVVRVGLAVYGLSPVPAESGPAGFGLRPAMRYAARLAAVKAVPAGQGVSYGLTWHAAAPTTLGLVPAGYADGIPRALSNRGTVGVAGVRRPVVGRVCMDQFVVDLGPDSAAAPGDEVVLIGDGVDGPTAQEQAEAADSISWEIVTRIPSRLGRLFVAGGPAAAAAGLAAGGVGRTGDQR